MSLPDRERNGQRAAKEIRQLSLRQPGREGERPHWCSRVSSSAVGDLILFTNAIFEER